jgi:di/tricarboxylate transporter
LLARGDWSQLDELRKDAGLEVNAEFKLKQRSFEDVEQVLAEVMIAPRSRLIGSSLGMLDPGWNHDTTSLGIHRRGQVLRQELRNVRLQVGDILVMLLPESGMAALRKDTNVIVLSERQPDKSGGWRAPFALVTMALVIGVSAVGWAPIAISSLVGAVAMALAGCLDAEDVYDSIDWRIIILMGGLLPLGIAMSQTGAAQFLVDNTIGRVSPFGPWVVLAVFYLMGMVLTEFMSNAATVWRRRLPIHRFRQSRPAAQSDLLGAGHHLDSHAMAFLALPSQKLALAPAMLPRTWLPGRPSSQAARTSSAVFATSGS